MHLKKEKEQKAFSYSTHWMDCVRYKKAFKDQSICKKILYVLLLEGRGRFICLLTPLKVPEL